MPEMRMNSLKSRAMNCGPLSEMIRGLASRYLDRKSTRLNSSHSQISYAVFCLKKKKKKTHMVSEVDLSFLLSMDHLLRVVDGFGCRVRSDVLVSRPFIDRDSVCT